MKKAVLILGIAVIFITGCSKNVEEKFVEVSEYNYLQDYFELIGQYTFDDKATDLVCFRPNEASIAILPSFVDDYFCFNNNEKAIDDLDLDDLDRSQDCNYYFGDATLIVHEFERETTDPNMAKLFSVVEKGEPQCVVPEEKFELIAE